MQHITGISRKQLKISSLEDKITSDNPIRFIEAFIENISLKSVGFIIQTIKVKENTLKPMKLNSKKKRRSCLFENQIKI